MQMILMKRKFNTPLAAMLILCCAIFIGSCSKSGDDGGSGGDYYFRFKANGAAVDYSNTVKQAYYPGSTSVNTTTTGVTGFSSVISATADINQVLRNAVSVIMNGDAAFTTGIDYTTAGNSPLALMQFGYYDNSGKLYVMSKSLNLVNNPGSATVRFTVINDDIIQGVFSAHLYDNTLNAHVQITEGEFRVKRKP